MRCRAALMVARYARVLKYHPARLVPRLTASPILGGDLFPTNVISRGCFMKSIIAAATIILVIATGTLIYTQTKAPAASPLQGSMPAAWSGNERIIPKLQDKLKQEPDNPDWNSALGLAYLQKARETGDPTYYTKADALFDRALAS